MSSYLEQITLNNIKIKELEEKIPSLIQSQLDWQQDAAKRICNQTLKIKRDACIKERDNSLRMSSQRIQEINAIRGQIEGLKQENKNLEAKITAEAQAKVELAKQGQSVEALVIQAQGTAQSEMIKAGAQAESILKTTETQNSAKKQTTFLVLGIMAIVAVVVIFFLVKKLKK
jgi:cobalamin biosynthesis Mg chelatase CobN